VLDFSCEEEEEEEVEEKRERDGTPRAPDLR